MYNENLYNEALYNEIDYKPTPYEKSNTGVNFGNGFSLPFAGCNAFDFKYLDTRGVNYSLSRLTNSTLNTYDIEQKKGVLKITGTLEGKNREEVLEKTLEMKHKIFGKLENVITKDGGKEFINNYTVKSIKFKDEFYNNTWLDFEIILDFYENLKENKIVSEEYKNITENNKEFNLFNPGEETDFIAILKINNGNNKYSIFLNNILIHELDLVANDIIFIDSNKIAVYKNGLELVFSGIISKLKTNENIFKITDTGSSRNYNLEIKYKKSFN